MSERVDDDCVKDFIRHRPRKTRAIVTGACNGTDPDYVYDYGGVKVKEVEVSYVYGGPRGARPFFEDKDG